MKKRTKIWLITAAALVLIGSIIFGSVMSMLGWDFMKLSTLKYETNTYEFAESYEDIVITVSTADIRFALADNGKTSVVCYETENMKHSVMVRDNTLYIEKQNNIKWYEYIGIGFNSPEITVYLPHGEYEGLNLETSTGDTDIPKNLSFSSINILQSTGSVTLKASATGEVKIKTTTGEIYVEDMSAESLELSVSTGNVTVNDVECKENIKVSVSTGKTTLNQVKCNNLISSGTTGNITIGNVIVNDKISIKRSTGDVKFDSSDAAEIFAQTDTGDISGTLLSDKIFSAKTDTGKVDVPKSANGGICEVTTDTGNIRLKIN